MSDLRYGGPEAPEQLRIFLKAQGFPLTDQLPSVTRTGEFAAGGHYGIELSSINNARIMRHIFEEADRQGVVINRCDECRGIFRLPTDEIREMAAMCKERGVGLIMSIGPRAIYDTGMFVRTQNGRRMGYRLRGMKNITYALEDVLRAVDLGIRGFLVYDEGLLALLKQARTTGLIPATCVLKYSVHNGCSNPVAAKVVQGLGADTINPVPDLSIGMLAAMRQAVTCPIDVFTDTSGAAGGMIRTYDVSEIVYHAAPVYLKCGPVSQLEQNHLPGIDELNERLKQTRCVIETLERRYSEVQSVCAGEKTLGIPE